MLIGDDWGFDRDVSNETGIKYDKMVGFKMV